LNMTVDEMEWRITVLYDQKRNSKLAKELQRLQLAKVRKQRVLDLINTKE